MEPVAHASLDSLDSRVPVGSRVYFAAPPDKEGRMTMIYARIVDSEGDTPADPYEIEVEDEYAPLVSQVTGLVAAEALNLWSLPEESP
jgi:hypothetical protein